jgi:two-component system sensor histidine kinase BarA
MHYTVLYIEDNAMNRELMEMLLRHPGGISLDTAENGAQGLKLAEKKAYDLILTDLCLPDINGFQLRDQLRQLHLHALTPLIAVSGDQLEAEGRALFTDFLQKPFCLPELFTLLQQHLGLPAQK